MCTRLCFSDFGSTARLAVLLIFFVFAAAIVPTTSLANFPGPPDRASGSIDIVAVMVEFEPEENRFTTGDGTFDLDFLDSDDIIIDPLPHDRAYFEAHLDFAKNYFERVSNGILEINYEVLPEVVQVDGVMADYAPVGEDDSENFKLANLAEDAWNQVRESGQADLSDYDPDRTMFVVFHAGAGRDLELLGTTLDKTPQDIPSVYMGQDALSRLLDDPGFTGFEADDSGTPVTNTAILPQTQSRVGEDIEGNPFVLQLSINGIVTANIGSFIGLPDLFNTETGESGIGRFGLMDGASIFSYRGMFPPEPSAWEKKYLGWIDSYKIDTEDTQKWQLPAVSLGENESIARYNISLGEYYLLENRHRDPKGEGVTITIRTPEGEEKDYTFDNQEERFDPFDDSEYDEIMEPGVVVDVSNFDWSLPGGLDAAGSDDDSVEEVEDRELNGGILIWHIDESVIRRNIDDNEINANPDRRGVNLIEADGAQDIGRPLSRGDDSRFLQGHAFDFWWSGNDFTVITASQDSIVVYENRFGPDTQPRTRTSSGSPIDIEFYDFSDNIPEAHFRLRQAENELFTRKRIETDLDGLQTVAPAARAEDLPLSLSAVTSETDTSLIIPGRNGLRAVSLTEPQETAFNFNLPNSNQPLVESSGVFVSTFGEAPNTVARWNFSESGWEREFSIVDNFDIPALISKENDRLLIDENEYYLLGENLLSSEFPGQRSVTLNGMQVSTDRDRIHLPDGQTISVPSELQQSNRFYVGGLQEDQPGFYLLTDEQLYRIDHEDAELKQWVSNQRLHHPALLDWNSDGKIDAIFIDRQNNKLVGKNQNGATLNHFPVRPPDGYRFAGTPLIADINGDGNSELLITIQDDYGMEIIAYNHRMRQIREDFPLFIGSVDEKDTSPVHPAFIDDKLIAVSHEGDVTSWKFSNMGEAIWNGPYGEFEGNKIYSAPAETSSDATFSGLLNRDETYNWPNPANDHTHIRYETSEAADISIQVADMSGRIVFESDRDSRGGMPEDIEIDTSSWGSGVYFGRIEARNGNDRESRMIKIVIQH